MTVEISNKHPALRFSASETIHVVKSVLAGEIRKNIGISVVFTGHRFMRSLNKRFLKRDYSTDVIAFHFDDRGGLEGEVYVNLDRARRQAQEYGVTFGNETRRLLIHGTLHVLGYLDGTKKEKRVMHEREEYYLKRLEAR